MENKSLRPIIKSDWNAISKIYAEDIKTDIATFEIKIPDWNTWNSKYYKNCRIVSQIFNEITGYAVLSNISKRAVYKGVAEAKYIYNRETQKERYRHYIIK